MRSLLAPASLVFAALAIVTTAHGEPQLSYSWDQCDPVIRNKDFAGPVVYRQTLSAVDLPAGLNGFTIGIALYAAYDAWRFDYGGCQGDERFTAVPSVEGCDGIPGLSLQWGMVAPVLFGHFEIYVNGYIDPPLAADLAGRTGLVTLEFDHALSGTTCLGETSPNCFHVDYAAYGLSGFPFSGQFGVVDGFLGWQDPQNTVGCPGATPVRARTWGRVKALYR